MQEKFRGQIFKTKSRHGKWEVRIKPRLWAWMTMTNSRELGRCLGLCRSGDTGNVISGWWNHMENFSQAFGLKDTGFGEEAGRGKTTINPCLLQRQKLEPRGGIREHRSSTYKQRGQSRIVQPFIQQMTPRPTENGGGEKFKEVGGLHGKYKEAARCLRLANDSALSQEIRGYI